MKINLTFLALLCGVSKGFMKAFKAFIKPSQAPQSAKIKFKLIFSLRQGLAGEGLSKTFFSHSMNISCSKKSRVIQIIKVSSSAFLGKYVYSHYWLDTPIYIPQHYLVQLVE